MLTVVNCVRTAKFYSRIFFFWKNVIISKTSKRNLQSVVDTYRNWSHSGLHTINNKRQSGGSFGNPESNVEHVGQHTYFGKNIYVTGYRVVFVKFDPFKTVYGGHFWRMPVCHLPHCMTVNFHLFGITTLHSYFLDSYLAAVDCCVGRIIARSWKIAK